MPPRPPPAEKALYARLKARQLALLVALHDHRSLRKAAQEIAISQPAATKMLHELEGAFGVPLFVRHAWGMEPTLYGDALTRYARGMLTDIRAAREEVTALAAGMRGKLRVGAVTGAVPRLLVPALEAVRARAPLVQVFLLVNASEVLGQALREGRLEVGIGPALPAAQAAGILQQPLARERLCVVARRGHALARRRALRMRDLARTTWVLQPPGTAGRDAIDTLFARDGIDPAAGLIETVSIVGTLALLQETDALSVLPVDLAQSYEAHGMLTRIEVRLTASTEYVLMTRSDRELSPLAAAFVAAARRPAGLARPAPR